MIKQMPFVETDRLYLRGLEEEDVCDIYAYLSMEETREFLDLEQQQNIDQTWNLLYEEYLPYIEKSLFQCWVMEQKQSGKVIGHLRLYEEQQCLYVEMLLHPAYWKQGYKKEALMKMLQHVYTFLKHQNVYVKVRKENKNCIFLLESLGFQYITCVKEILSNGKMYDMWIERLSEKEWRKQNEKNT